jgi:hypothetical protein
LDQLGEEKKVFRYTPNNRMVLGLEFCIDSLCFGSNRQVGCAKSEFVAMSYSHFYVERFVSRTLDRTRRCRVRSAPVSPVTESGQCSCEGCFGAAIRRWL